LPSVSALAGAHLACRAQLPTMGASCCCPTPRQ